ncbi:hypothetical protein Tco_0452082 [Tanacetum coccineum]
MVSDTGEDEPKLLDTTIGRVVLLLPVAPARGESELEDSVDMLFDEESKDGQAKQGDSASGGQEKQKSVIVDSDEPSHPAKKLRKDHGIPVGTSVAGKSMPAIQRLLAGAVQNVAVRGEPVPSLPFVMSSVSTMPEREDKRHTDTLAGVNLQTFTAPQRFVISSDFCHHSGTHIAETEADSLIRSSAPAMTTATTVTITASAATVVKETVEKPSLFATGSSSVGGTESIPVGFSDLSGNDFLVGDIRTVIDPDSDLQKVYVPRWNVANGFTLDDNRDCLLRCGGWNEFAPPKVLASVHGMDRPTFAEFNVERLIYGFYYTLDENTYPEFLYENGEEMDLLTFIRTADLTKVRIGERQRGEDEPKLLDTTIRRVVPLLPVAPARGESELEDSMDRLFDEEGKDGQEKQGDSASGGQAGKSMPAIQRLLAGAVQNVAVRGELVPSLPFVTSSVSTTPKREDKRHTDTLAGANLQTFIAPQRFVISSDSYHHFGTHIAETEARSLIRSSTPAMTTATTVTVTASAATVVKETVVKPSLFATGSSSVGGTESIPVGFSDLTGNDFLVGDIRTVINPNSDLQKVYVP